MIQFLVAVTLVVGLVVGLVVLLLSGGQKIN